MVSRQAQRRLNQEYKTVSANPPPYIVAKPTDENILEWHYVITGPPKTPYENGQYHGMLRFPSEYPFKPPSISIITPNGRFACNTRLCLSMSDYHPDTWNPAWSVLTILTGLLSFMTGDEQTTGSITSSDMVKRKLAEESKKWNLTENTRFGAVFPELKIQNAKDIAAAEAEKQQKELMQKEKESESVAPLEMEALDAEDRARLLVHQEQPIDGGLLLTLVGMLVAAVLAVYMYF
ncbi:CIC11C00000001646 [Sungouiella intermedia]|uniref:Ubiquitin-conjugating enzyme E2 6 n=1 Tax=Sungouiella intermedia TaxID=45354 RepID=A0A1L0BE29_9ASCO|nr:CIC11C00000001646 [[Candida] intermedia]